MENFQAFIVKVIAVITAILTAIYSLFGVGGTTTFKFGDHRDDESVTRVMSYNVKNGVNGIQAVSYREKYVCSEIAEYLPDSVGTQETSVLWRTELSKQLGEIYAMVGTGREGGDIAESNSILYRKDKFELSDSGTFWLSETPDVPGSKSWDSKYTRICTWVVLKNKETGKQYAHVNTHLDYSSVLCQRNQAELVINKVKELSLQYPTVLTGDFYTYMGGENYKYITGQLTDARYASTGTFDNKSTYRGWDGSNKDTAVKSTDFIFVDTGSTRVLNFAVIDNITDNVYPSDHCALYADMLFGN